jgi:acetyl-CoA synthetase
VGDRRAHRVNILGVSPTLIASLMRHGEDPFAARSVVAAHPRLDRRAVESRAVAMVLRCRRAGTLPIINYSGGTEVSGGLVGGNVITPLKPAAFAGPPPGSPRTSSTIRPARAQPGRGARRDAAVDRHDARLLERRERYLQTYWSRFPDVWVHGDWAAIDDDGLWYILGRSDDTIKIAGKRLGPAEVESVLVDDPAVLEAAAIGVPTN